MNDNYNDYGCIVTMKSSPAEKIRLMSLMFYGRRDVFARRYEREDGRGGYAPLCSNEWVRGVCGKCAKVKGDCATCVARDFLPIPFGGNPDMAVDFISEQSKLAIEIDGSHHFADRDAYRRDRRKDELLQENGYFILRFLADDVMNNLGEVMARVIRRLK